MPTGFLPFSRRLARRQRTLVLAALLALAPLAPLAAVGAGAAPPACGAARAAGDRQALRSLQRQLLQAPPRPEPLAPLLARAEHLLACGAPDGALVVLDRLSPAPGPERQAWLLLRWQAAAAGLQHRLAADSLQLLAAGDPAGLAGLELPLPGGGRRSGVEVMADHLEALGWRQQAVAVLLAGQDQAQDQNPTQAAATAARIGRAVDLAVGLPEERRRALLERALDQAAAAGAWGLVALLLDQQLDPVAADGQALERRLRLSGRIDDAYGEWRLRRALPAADPRAAELERQLRSPRAAGGHAATAPAPVQP